MRSPTFYEQNLIPNWGKFLQIKPIATTTIYHSKDCAKSYDWHSKALDGYLIQCRCPHSKKVDVFVYLLMTNNVRTL